jgi:hypothetical protein
LLATAVGEGSRISSGFDGVDLGRRAGNRPATVQQVEAERNEQSGSNRGAAEDDWAAAHPPSSAMPSSATGVGIIRMALGSLANLSRAPT